MLPIRQSLISHLCSQIDSPGIIVLVFKKSYGIYFLKIYLFIYLFIERGKGREKERERNINEWLPLLGTWPAAQACAPTGNRTSDPLVRRPVPHPLSHSSQGLFYLLMAPKYKSSGAGNSEMPKKPKSAAFK